MSLFNPYEQFSIYPLDDYGDHGGILSHELVGSTSREPDEEQARRSHPSAQQVEPDAAQRDLRERLAS
jgi:hypothetical protein